jgi:hypothetical protein
MGGKTVKLFLVDGTPNGLRTAEIFNWTGRATVSPRTALEKLGTRPEVGRTGVYVLCGPAESPQFDVSVYVGEADQVWSRLKSHDAQKDFWTWVIVLVSKDENLTKAHARWLEARLVREIRAAKLVDCVNSTGPEGGSLSESDLADMEAFFENVQLLLPVLGLHAIAPGAGGTSGGGTGDVRLELSWKSASARCRVTGDSYVVEKGSTAVSTDVDSLQPNYRELRRRLRETGVLVPGKAKELLCFAQDYAFESPTAAAVAVTGTSVNGRERWTVAGTGQSYKAWQSGRLPDSAA